jgi:dienelactone hydrolase
LNGCLYYGPQKIAIPQMVDPPAMGTVAYFAYTREEKKPSLERPKDWGLYQVQNLKLPASLKTDLRQTEYNLYYYRPKGQGPFPAVVILPITRGDYYTQNFAIYLAERGYACLRFESTKNFTDESHKTLESAEQLLRHYVIDVRRSIDWLLLQKEVDSSHLGIMGISLGAVVASVVMEVEPRIQAGVFLLGGADLAGIINTSEENSLIKFRRRVIAHDGLEEQKFREVAALVLKPIDPLTYAHQVNPDKILMINGYFDRVIQRKYVKAFWEALGRPELIFIPTGHYSAGLLVAYARAKTEAHFNRILRSSHP